MCFRGSVMSYDRAMLFAPPVPEGLQGAKRTRIVDSGDEDPLCAASPQISAGQRDGVFVVAAGAQNLDLAFREPDQPFDDPQHAAENACVGYLSGLWQLEQQ